MRSRRTRFFQTRLTPGYSGRRSRRIGRAARRSEARERDVATTHPHFKIAHELWDAIAHGDAAKLREFLSPKVQWRTFGGRDLGGTHVGVDAALDVLASIGDLADELRTDLIDIFVNDRGAVLWTKVHARRGADELRVEQLVILTIEGGQIVRIMSVTNDQAQSNRFWNATLGRADQVHSSD